MNVLAENVSAESGAAHIPTLTGSDMEAPAKIKTKKTKTDDQLVLMVQEISGFTAETAISEIATLIGTADESYIRLGGVLSLIQSKKFFEAEGYKNLKDLVETKFGIPYRKAMYWITIYDALIESGVPWAKVSMLGWTKLKDLAQILTLDNVDEWVERAQDMTVLQLKDAIDKFKAGTLKTSGLTPEDEQASEVTTFTVKVHTAQKLIIREAIEKAKSMSGTEFDGSALEAICMNFLSGGVASKPGSLVSVLEKYTPEDALTAFEKVYPNMDVTVKVNTKAKKASSEIVTDAA